MGLLGKPMKKSFRYGLLAFAVIGSLSFSLPVHALNEGIVYPGIPEGAGDAVVLEQIYGDYVVEEGDSLWKITGKIMGREEDYVFLYENNREIIEDPDRIYPGDRLSVLAPVYFHIISRTAGVDMGYYGFQMFPEWRVGLRSMGTSHANWVLLMEDYQYINCLVRSKQEEAVQTLADWQECQERIRQYVEENYAHKVRNLEFLQYRTQRGDILCLYTFVYEVDEEQTGVEGTYPIPVCMGIRLTESMQAEFLYYGAQEGETGIRQVRYVAGTVYEKEGLEKEWLDEQNMQLLPEVEWPLEGLFNPFGWLDAAFDLKEPEKTPEDLFKKSMPIH